MFSTVIKNVAFYVKGLSKILFLITERFSHVPVNPEKRIPHDSEGGSQRFEESGSSGDTR